MKKTIIALTVILALLCVAAYFYLRPQANEALASATPATTPSATATPVPTVTPAPTPEISIEAVQTPEKPHKYVFIMIGDGMGQAQRELAQDYAQFRGDAAPLIMNSLPVTGSVATASLSSAVTDSAAAATAYATGHKTNNGMLSVTPGGEELKTIMEQAEEAGLSTGIITTTTLSNATPAAFAAHVKSRASEAGIALQYLDSGVDFFAGGGDKYFLPSSYSGGNDAIGNPLISARGDDHDLVSEFEQAGYETFIGRQGALDFENYTPSAGDKVLASFMNDYMPYDLDRTGQSLITPSLADMTQKAIETLAFDEDGFVLMVEGGRIDHTCAANDPAGTVFETLEFNDAVQQAYDFYTQNPDDTLILVVGDHETGGLELGGELDLAPLAAVKLSVTESLHLAYTGDREAYFEYLSENFGLSDLNPSEKARIEDALDFADSRDYTGEYAGSPASVVSSILSKRIGVSWAGEAHTGVDVPLTAVGLRADGLSGSLENEQVGQFLFDVISPG